MNEFLPAPIILNEDNRRLPGSITSAGLYNTLTVTYTALIPSSDHEWRLEILSSNSSLVWSTSAIKTNNTSSKTLQFTINPEVYISSDYNIELVRVTQSTTPFSIQLDSVALSGSDIPIGTPTPTPTPTDLTPCQEVNVAEAQYAIGDADPSDPQTEDDKAFDGNLVNWSRKWRRNAGQFGWVGQDFGSNNKQKIGKYRIYPQYDGANTRAYDPKDWTFEASDTGIWGGEEVVLDTQTNQSFTDQTWNEYLLSNYNEYQYYRLNITAGNGTGPPLQFHELELVSCEPLPTPTPTVTPEPTPTPTPTCETDPPSSFDCGNTITWSVSDDTNIRFFEIYRYCSVDELYAPLSAYELIDVIYDPSAREYSDFRRPGCTICRYLVGAGNPKQVTYTPILCAIGCVAPTCTPTPTPTAQCYEWDYELGDPGVRYIRVLSDLYTDAVKYVKCVDITDERYLPIVPPTPPPGRPWCPTPTPTPTYIGVEFDLCYPTPTPTPTPTATPAPSPTPSPTFLPTPTPTPTSPYDGILVFGTSCISFAEARFNDNDYINACYENLNTGEKHNMFCKKLLIPDPGLTYCLPIQVGEEFEITIEANSEGIYPPCTINVMYDGEVVIKDIFLKKDENYKFKVYRPY